MKKSIGIDLGMEVSTLAVVDAEGQVVHRESIPMTREALGSCGGSVGAER